MARINVKGKRRKIQRGRQLLTKSELRDIRSSLPKKWRKIIAETEDGITLRQITEVFNQRTRTADVNVIVWRRINEMLCVIKREDLEKRVHEALSYWTALYNVTQGK